MSIRFHLSALRKPLAALTALSAVACGPSQVRVEAPPLPEMQVAGQPLVIESFTDLGTVRAVASDAAFTYVATDRGLQVYSESTVPEILGADSGLPSNDVYAVAVSPSGVATAATAAGFVEVRGARVENPVVPPAPVGRVRALHADADGTRWACGDDGLARLREGRWEGYGEPIQCTGLFPTPEGRLWVGTTRGLIYIDSDDVIREHGEGRGLPGGWIRGLVPAQPGQALALVQSATASYLAWFDGNRWYGYTLRDFDHVPVGLVRAGGKIMLLSRDYAFEIQDAATGSGVPLHPISRGERLEVLSFQARITQGGVAERTGEVQPPRPPSRLADLPPNQPTIDAPGWVISPLAAVGQTNYWIGSDGSNAYVADIGRGLSVLSGDGNTRELQRRDLVADEDLRLAVDPRGQTWLLSDDGVLALYRSGTLRAMPSPEGTRTGAMASSARGFFLVGIKQGSPNTLALHRMSTEGWELVYEATLTLPEGNTLIDTPFLGMHDDGTAYVGIRVREGEREGMRGLVQLSADGQSAIYHHHTSDPAVDGEGALRTPNEFSAIDMNDENNVWMATIFGAVRLGGSQAVTFGEARGVRGEVVSDVLVGSRGRIWVAAAEGPGYRQQDRFEFRMPEAIRASRPRMLALDPSGNIWGAGPSGLVRFDGEQWQLFGAEQGLPSADLKDIEIDAEGGIWVLASDRVMRIAPASNER